MLITKDVHACVRIERDGRVLVIDPGIWSGPDVLAGADAVLLTHEHADHVDADRLAVIGLPVFAPQDADLELPEGVDVVRVSAGDVLDVAGFQVRAVGGRHATTYDGRPDCANLGYLVDGLYHPGDSLHVPDEPVDTLLVPVSGPWLRLDEAIDFVRAVAPQRAYAIHDGVLNDRGLAIVNGWLDQEAGTDYRWVAPGDVMA